MSTTSHVQRFVERLLLDPSLADDLHKASTAAERSAHLVSRGLDPNFTQAELDAELVRLKQAAGVLAPLESTVAHGATGAHAQWVSRLANLAPGSAHAGTCCLAPS